MKAIVYTKYGPPEDVLELREVEKPTPKDNEVLVKIHAASINWADNAAVRGSPVLVRASHGLLRPKKSDTRNRHSGAGRSCRRRR